MSSSLGEAVIDLDADSSPLKNSIGDAKGFVESSLGTLGNVAKGVLAVGMGAAAAAVGGLTAALGLSVKEAMDAQAVQAQLNAVLTSTGGAAGVTAEMANDLATSLSEVTRFSDEAITAGESMLLTFTGIGKDVFPDATQAMLDMAQAMGGDVQGTAIQLGKALNNPKEGLTALTRVGVTFTEEQKKLIESLQAAGDVAGAQKIILAELEKEFGGSAEAAGKTFAGQLDILKNSLLNVAEGIGTQLLPYGQEFLTDVVIPLVDRLAAMGDVLATNLGPMLQGLVDIFVNGKEPLGDWSSFWDAFANVFGPQAATTITDIVSYLQTLWQWLGTNIPMAIQAVSDYWKIGRAHV